jgi:DNA-binding response OmpR family regulator
MMATVGRFRASTSAVSVLIAEDEAVVSVILRRQLEDRGYVISGVVSRSDEVVGAVQRHRPDVVVMDIRLDSTTDGVTLAEELFVCEDTAVVFLSATEDEEINRRVVHSGAYGYLVKPVVLRSLVSTVELAVQKHKDLMKCRAEAKGLSETFNSLQSSLVVLDGKGQVVFMNRAAVELTGWMLVRAKDTPPPWVEALWSAWPGARAEGGAFSTTLPRGKGDALSVSARGFELDSGGVTFLISRDD